MNMIFKEMPTAPCYEKANKRKCEEATAHFKRVSQKQTKKKFFKIQLSPIQ